jgi:hypothetical protein
MLNYHRVIIVYQYIRQNLKTTIPESFSILLSDSGWFVALVAGKLGEHP